MAPRNMLFIGRLYPFKRQPHKTVKQTQTIRRLLPANRLNACDQFVGLALKFKSS